MDDVERNRLAVSVRPWVAKLVHARVERRHAEDMIQNCYVHLLRALPKYNPTRGTPTTFTAAVVNNYLSRRAKSAEDRREELLRPLPLRLRDPRQRLAEDVHDDAEQCDRLKVVMQQLDDGDRDALERVVLDGLPVAGINRDLSRERCRQVFRRALNRARQLMETRP